MNYLIRILYACSLVCLSWSLALFTAPSVSYTQEFKNPHYPEIPATEALPYVDTYEEVISPPGISSPSPSPSPSPHIVTVRMLVTACSPQDRIDVDYYARHGYEGSIYNIAADTSILPRGTKIRVPGYMPVSFPGRWWVVDSAGGSIIRRASRRGIIQIDVKFRTEYSALRWGRKWLDVEIIIPDSAEGDRLLRRLHPHMQKEHNNG